MTAPTLPLFLPAEVRRCRLPCPRACRVLSTSASWNEPLSGGRGRGEVLVRNTYFQVFPALRILVAGGAEGRTLPRSGPR